MAFDLDNLGGLAADVLRDTRTFNDPWGFGYEFEVLRHNHPDFQRFELNAFAARPQAEVLRRASTDYAFSEMEPDGFRQGKRLTKGERFRRMKQEVSKPVELATQIDDLRDLKPGIASILIRKMSLRGETEVRKGGKVYDLTKAEDREAFLNHEIWFLTVDGGETAQQCIRAFKRLPDGSDEVDETDAPIEEYLAGWNVGDALAELCVKESKDTAAFVERQGEKVLDLSVPVADGSTVTGSPAAPQSEES